MTMKFDYPTFPKDDVSDDFFGVKVFDEYRWLEDPDSKKTTAFVKAQNDITMPYINKCKLKEKINQRLTEMFDYPKYGCPFKRGSNYFYFYNTGLQNQSVLYILDDLKAEPRVFLDPNKFSEDGTVALNGTRFSEDGEYFAYGLSAGGSDWVTIKFKKVSTGKDLPDVLEKVKFTSMAWTHDNQGFFYNCFPDQEGKTDGTETTVNINHKLYYHVLGTPQSKDILCAEFLEEPKWMIGADVSECGRYVIVSVSEGCEPKQLVYFCDLELINYKITDKLPLTPIIDKFEADFDYITNEGMRFIFKTNLDAPLYKLIVIDFSNPDRENWKDLIKCHDTDLLEWAACVHKDNLMVCHLKDVKNVLSVYDAMTGRKKYDLPIELGTIDSFSGRKKDNCAFVRFVSFLSPGVIYKCDFTKEKPALKVFKEIIVKGFKPNQFQISQVFYPSKDGTKIPMFIVKPKSIQMNGDNPCLLYAYGGFNISITPYFSVSRLLNMQHFQGVFALANIRGGGEYGKEWHDAGRLANKQNCFDDFQSAAEYLIDKKFTSPKKLIIQGGSNGGLLVGACINQRPELYGAAIAQVGVMDMLRFHKFTIGHAWTSDFGNPDEKECFKYIYRYSPLHNINTKSPYPAVLLVTADHDDRVVPLHSYKYIAKLQELVGKAEYQTNPLLIRIDIKAGHGAGKPMTKIIEELTDVYAFLQMALNLEWFD